MFKGIKNLYLIKGKIVFRMHLRKNGKEKNVWKVIGRPDEFSEKELREIVSKLTEKIWKDVVKTREVTEDSGSSYKLTKVSEKRNYYENKVRSQRVTLGVLVNRFLFWYRETRRPSSYERHLMSSKPILEFFGKDTPVDEIDLEKVEMYKIWRKNTSGVSEVTINKELRFLSTLINRAVEFRWIENHELYRKPILIRGVESERLRYLTEEEEKKLLSAIKNLLLKDIVIFALNTGLRRNEILNLTWDEVDFYNRCVVLKPTKTKSKRKHILPLNQKA